VVWGGECSLFSFEGFFFFCVLFLRGCVLRVCFR